MKLDDLEKLKLLANSIEDYLNALLLKLRENAIDNNHDMSQFIHDHNGYVNAPRGWDTYTAHCRKCPFEIEVEFMDTHSGEKIYFDIHEANARCER